MSNIINLVPAEKLTIEASQWVIKLDGQRLSPTEFAAFKAWVTSSEAHETAFRSAAGTWGNLDILKQVPTLSSLKTQQRAHSVFWWGKFHLKQVSMAAALILLVTFSVNQLLHNAAPALPVIYGTALGDNKSIELSDGSRVILNTESQVEIQYEANRRVIKLLKGEAHFEVASNKARPFEVYAGTNIVRAIGTAFAVQVKPEMVAVTVTEGTVQLATLVQDPEDRSVKEVSLAFVQKGQTAEFNENIKTINSIAPNELDRRLAWRSGTLVFNGQPLEQVIEEIHRYTTTQIIIADPEIRSLKIGGYFKTSEIEDMLKALETGFNVTVTRINKNLVYLSKSNKN
ncbi:FecR family protein [Paremcibacter congregatus]|uniref:FecR protein domain-containing protein n=1 Tax=Paremcibacter congregatus TaxID=2043170 RepID=A0A2G4YVX9_9PROT|nr:FecR domain-containing protein [Paremcibacter congregatus]PHZ86400.1 hypothetical protein CRD36_00480 [Paremcibacter congregatus]QDE28505.1 DUF4974 domain-containing protein [Paremcibacter congregatus]